MLPWALCLCPAPCACALRPGTWAGAELQSDAQGVGFADNSDFGHDLWIIFLKQLHGKLPFILICCCLGAWLTLQV